MPALVSYSLAASAIAIAVCLYSSNYSIFSGNYADCYCERASLDTATNEMSMKEDAAGSGLSAAHGEALDELFNRMNERGAEYSKSMMKDLLFEEEQRYQRLMPLEQNGRIEEGTLELFATKEFESIDSPQKQPSFSVAAHLQANGLAATLGKKLSCICESRRSV